MVVLLMLAAFFIVLFQFKSKILQLFIFVFSYPIFITYGYKVGVEPTRIISAVGFNKYHDVLDTAFYVQIIALCAFIIPLWGIRDKIFEMPRLQVKNDIRFILLILFVISLMIAYPRSMFISDSRFGFGGSACLVLSALLIACRQSKIDIIDIITFCLSLMIFINGERVDFLVFIFVFFLIENKDGVIKERNMGVASSFILGSLIFILATLIGMKRGGENFDLFVILNSILSQGTAVDVIHVYLSCVKYVQDIGYDIRPLWNIIASFIPFIPGGGAISSYNATEILREYIYNLGGGLFYTAGYMIFGVSGVVIMTSIYSLFIRFTFSSGFIGSAVLLVITLQQLRIQWYGITYLANSIMLMVLLGLAYYLVTKSLLRR